MPLQKPDNKPNFPAIESKIAEFWKNETIFKKSVDMRIGKPAWRFYDGPPFISGTPHYGHIKDMIVKDAVPRYWSMKGYYTPRVWGWDCHGLPIENKVEKKLGIKSKLEVEEYGIDKYIEECYNYTRDTSAEWPWYIEKMGRWIDYDHAYRTMDQNYMESVWWVFKQLHEKNLIYKGWRSSLYSTDSATPVSNFEIAMDDTYEEVEDDSVTVKFKLKQDDNFKAKFANILKDSEQQVEESDVLARGVHMLAWTTTPWTLPANFALAVNPEEDYVLAKVSQLQKHTHVWMLKNLPFDFNRQNPVKFEKIILSFKGEEGSDETQLKLSDKDTYPELTDLELALTKIGKKFYFSQNNNLKEISQGEYQTLAKTAKSKPIFGRKVFYRYGEDAKFTIEITMFDGDLVGMQYGRIDFLTANDYNSFITQMPEWFGEEVADEFTLNSQLSTHEGDVGELMKKVELKASTHMQSEFDYVVLATKLAEQVLYGSPEIITQFKGSELTGLSYEPVYEFFAGGENDHKIYPAEIVTVTDGTGVLHVAPAFGEEDFELGQKHGLSFTQCIDAAGKMLPETGKFAGIYLRDVAMDVVNDLEASGKLYNHAKYKHRLPFYRYENPLIYRAQESWFIDVQSQKEKLIAENENINWIPDHLKNGRFKIGIESAPDWSISRSRYWLTPMPIWTDMSQEQAQTNSTKIELNPDDSLVIGTRDELRKHAVQEITKVTFVTFRNNANKDANSNPDLETLYKSYLDPKQTIQSYSGLEKIIYTEESSSGDFKASLHEIFQKLEFNEQAPNENQPIFATSSSEFEHLVLKLKEKDSAGRVQDLDEEQLASELDTTAKDIVLSYQTFLKNYEGSEIVVVVKPEILAVMRKHFEKKSWKESLASLVEDGEVYAQYYMDGQLLDLHRPVIDKVQLKHPKSGKILTRISSVLDNWLDSGSMPFAQLHYPFENKENFENAYPGDYIFEYIAQTRAWFYVMHVLGVAMTDKNAFNNVGTSGVISGNDGRKMSKSYGNYPDPRVTIETFGAEALRWYILNSKLIVGQDISFNEKALRDQLRLYILPLWNSYSFFATYAQLHNWQPRNELITNETSQKQTVYSTPVGSEIETYWYKVPFKDQKDKLDIWLITKLQKLIRDVRTEMDMYIVPKATKMLEEFIVEDVSKWYIRRSRSRFSSGDQEAFETLYYVLVEFIKLTAPLTPFIAEEIYQKLVVDTLEGQQESVHLNDYPHSDMDYLEKNDKLMQQMEAVREIVSLGQSLRVQNSLKVRQPLSKLQIRMNIDPARDKQLENWMENLIKEELNVLEVSEHERLDSGEDWLNMDSQASSIAISLNKLVTPLLARQGLHRELVRLIQSARKAQGLSIGDIISLEIITSDIQLIDTLKEYNQKIAEDVKASKINLIEKSPAEDKAVKINDISLEFSIVSN